MANNRPGPSRHASSSRHDSMDHPSMSLPFGGNTNHRFDILEWHPAHQSCLRFFLDHAQHEPATQALCALLNILLPFQWRAEPVSSSTRPDRTAGDHGQGQEWLHHPRPKQQVAAVSLVPYIRRLIVTGFDSAGILHGFFGRDWEVGVGPLRECERRNYLFAAKSGGWKSCKQQYDMADGQTVPFLQPPREVKAEELEAAEGSWSEWLAFEDWMVGPRAMEREGGGRTDGFNVDMTDAEGRRR